MNMALVLVLQLYVSTFHSDLSPLLYSDGDGFLNLDEFNTLQLATGSDSVEEGDWDAVCGMFSVDPSKGFDIPTLAQGYESSSDGQLLKDAQMVMKLRKAEKGVSLGDDMEEISSESESDIEEGVVDPNDIARVDALSEHQVYKID